MPVWRAAAGLSQATRRLDLVKHGLKIVHRWPSFSDPPLTLVDLQELASAIDAAIGIPGAVTRLLVTPQRLREILRGS